MRASDRDREQTAERLRHAAGEGRLFPEELEERLRAALMARTYGELEAIVSDLPQPGRPAAPRPHRLARLRPALPWLVAFVALLLILMVMAAGLAVRREASFGAAPTVQSAAPAPPP